jgi:putative SOS response-associated peptidase YedK
MCGRYRRTTQEEELARLYHIPIPKQTDLPISYNIAPNQKVLTIRFNPETRARSLDSLQWGLIPHWTKDSKIAYRTINARAETVDKAPSYRQAFAKRRCLIPADGFYDLSCNSAVSFWRQTQRYWHGFTVSGRQISFHFFEARSPRISQASPQSGPSFFLVVRSCSLLAAPPSLVRR